MKNPPGLIGLGLLLANIALAAQFPVQWRNVQLAPVDQTGLVKLSVPLETLDAARPALEDLRLYDDLGREVSFQIDRPTQTQTRVRPAKSLQVTLTTDVTVAMVETGIGEVIDGVTLQSPAPGFLKGVQVEGSSDGGLIRVDSPLSVHRLGEIRRANGNGTALRLRGM